MFDEQGRLERVEYGRVVGSGWRQVSKPVERRRTALDSTFGSWVINSPFFFFSLHLFVDSVLLPVKIVFRVRLCSC